MRKRFARREDLGLTPAEFRVLQRLDTPHKIQAYLNSIPQNFEPDGQTALSVREVLRQRRSHCIEGGMLAAAALWVHGERPLLLDLSAENDYDHVVALFRRNGCWGAISKTNHYALRYRDPVYRTLRELAISYFHEYANRRGQKSLRKRTRTGAGEDPQASLAPDFATSRIEGCHAAELRGIGCARRHRDLVGHGAWVGVEERPPLHFAADGV